MIGEDTAYKNTKVTGLWDVIRLSGNHVFVLNKLLNIIRNNYKYIIIITHSERALFNLNARVEARGTIVPKAVGRAYYGPERRHKGI